MACVYVLTNPAIPGMVKIGFTGGDAQSRAAEISRATGVPSAFDVAWCIETTSAETAHRVEQSVHRALAQHRVNNGREFFRMTVADAADAIEGIAYHMRATPDSEIRHAMEQAQREAAERAQREAAERAQREAAEQAQREAAERAQREAAQREAAQRAQREAAERAQRELHKLAFDCAYSMPYLAGITNETMHPSHVHIYGLPKPEKLPEEEHRHALNQLVRLCGREEAIKRINNWVTMIREIDRDVRQYLMDEALPENERIYYNPGWWVGAGG